jgi:hypothetical protein
MGGVQEEKSRLMTTNFATNAACARQVLAITGNKRMPNTVIAMHHARLPTLSTNP